MNTLHFPPSTGDIRNDLYLTLEKGDFERGGKSVQKNIEVTMYVLYADGEILKVRLVSNLEWKLMYFHGLSAQKIIPFRQDPVQMAPYVLSSPVFFFHPGNTTVWFEEDS